VRGAGAAQIAAHQTRDDKLPAITHEEMQQKHREMAAQFTHRKNKNQNRAFPRSADEKGVS
jgi:hypothetical protein